MHVFKTGIMIISNNFTTCSTVQAGVVKSLLSFSISTHFFFENLVYPASVEF